MIGFDFEYHQPETVEEATRAFRDLDAGGKQPLYYGGGTEILSDARLEKIRTGAVVDLKAIPECTELGRRDGHVVFGAGVTLAHLCEAGEWPLLSEAAGRVADHTVRCKITLGGNIAGRIQYREAVLPLLLVDAQAVVAGPDGLRRAAFADVFDGTLKLARGEFLAQVVVGRADTALPHVCFKKTRLDWVDYPLLTAAALNKEGQVRVAFSGLCDHPFRSRAMEDALNDRRATVEERVHEAVQRIPAPVLDDIHGTADYRRFVLRNTLEDVLGRLAGL